MRRGFPAVALAVLAGLLGLLIATAAGDDDGTRPAYSSGVDESKIPPLARDMLPVVTDVLREQCPELPAVWVVAEVMAESSWRPHAWSNDRNGGAAGLYQINQRNWIAAGGRPWAGVPPGPASDIYVPETQLRVDIPWVCANLRAVSTHLAATGKPTTPLDAMAVCHIAGCGRVTLSATGIPRPGEAGCGAVCVGLIHRYLDNIHRYVAEFSAPPPRPPPAPFASPEPEPALASGPASSRPAQVAGTTTVGGITTPTPPPPPAPYAGPPGTACTVPDPSAPAVTSPGAAPPTVVTRGMACVTTVVAWALHQQVTAFGPLRGGPTLRDTTCWSAPPRNPTGDQAQGRACDLYPGRASVRAAALALQHGWRLANWLRLNARPLHIAAVVWQSRSWRPGDPDLDGWGRPYADGGLDDVNSGAYDHLHVTFTR
jgi:hypothetical protein